MNLRMASCEVSATFGRPLNPFSTNWATVPSHTRHATAASGPSANFKARSTAVARQLALLSFTSLGIRGASVSKKASSFSSLRIASSMASFRTFQPRSTNRSSKDELGASLLSSVATGSSGEASCRFFVCPGKASGVEGCGTSAGASGKEASGKEASGNGAAGNGAAGKGASAAASTVWLAGNGALAMVSETLLAEFSGETSSAASAASAGALAAAASEASAASSLAGFESPSTSLPTGSSGDITASAPPSSGAGAGAGGSSQTLGDGQLVVVSVRSRATLRASAASSAHRPQGLARLH
mmetsp:Transcript_14946/g.56746  ORF Transcript_14946/g.56746 Transcript_14946/m.56746 type:complete len:299 (-) Transcript_14946:68-964(-)